MWLDALSFNLSIQRLALLFQSSNLSLQSQFELTILSQELTGFVSFDSELLLQLVNVLDQINIWIDLVVVPLIGLDLVDSFLNLIDEAGSSNGLLDDQVLLSEGVAFLLSFQQDLLKLHVSSFVTPLLFGKNLDLCFHALVFV
jgi:hypothetical protein